MKFFFFALLIFYSTSVNAENKLRILLQNSVDTKAYELSEEKWLLFPFSTPAFEARIVTHAAIPESLPKDPEKKWHYKVRAEILDLTGDVIESREMAYESRVIYFHEPNLGTYTPYFFAEGDAVPTLTNLSILNWSDKSRGSYLRIRLVQKDKDIIGVYGRVFEKPTFKIDNPLSTWYRLDPESQTKLADGNVFDLSLLSQNEKRNIIENLWEPIGPQGMPGESYNIKYLYEVLQQTGKPLREPILPDGMLISKKRFAVLPVEEDETSFDFKISPLQHIGEVSGQKLNLLLYNRLTDKPQKFTVTTNDMGRASITLQKGLVVISSEMPFIFQARKNGEEIELDTLGVKSFKASQTHPITFEVSHFGSAITPMRFVFRETSLNSFKNDELKVAYHLLDHKNQILKSGELSFERRQSPYDWVKEDLLLNVSYANEVYFVLPKDVKKIRFFPSDPTYISGSNRPDKLVRNFEIPEDIYSFGSEEESMRRSWFYLFPLDADRLVREGQSLVFITQPEPKETDPRILAGQYDWKQLFPKGSWTSDYFLTPQSEGSSRSLQAQETTYMHLKAPFKRTVSFKGRIGTQYVTPNLIFIKDTDELQSIFIGIDGKIEAQKQESGFVGNLKLPTLKEGKHLLTITGFPKADIFLNFTNAKENTFYKRQALKLGSKVSKISLHKTSNDDQILILYVYGKKDTESTVHVSISGPSDTLSVPLQEYTIRDRQYVVRFTGPQVYFLKNENDFFHAAEAIFMQFGKDLPKGTYSIAIQADPSIYGVLSHLQYGYQNKRTVTLEPQPIKEDH